jgi:hypothetical protein
LAASDVNAIWQQIGQNFPEINPSGNWQFGNPGTEAAANTDPWTGNITIDQAYSNPCLTEDEFNSLYFDLLHEEMHSTDLRSTRLWDNFWQFYGVLTQNHQSIYNRVSWEECGVVPPSEAAAGLWGYGPDDTRRPPISPKVSQLYQKTRPCGCGN